MLCVNSKKNVPICVPKCASVACENLESAADKMLRKTEAMKPKNLKVVPTHGLALTVIMVDSTMVIIADMDMDTVVVRTLAIIMDRTTVLTGVLKDSLLDSNLALMPSLATHRKALASPVSQLRSKNL